MSRSTSGHHRPRAIAADEHRGGACVRLVGTASRGHRGDRRRDLFVLAQPLFFSNTLEDWLTDRPTFRAATTAVDEEGWRVVLLLRLSPVVPFGLLNYMLGLTRTPLISYVIWTAVGVLLVASSMFTSALSAQTSAARHNLLYLIVGFIATVAAAILITVKSRAYLQAEGVKV